MKIHKIQFKNINNLKGEHTISFAQFPLSTAGIFAIVGPTGSGKSTILDVITLALFNRIPRFSKAITKNEMTNEGSVVTHHCSEASATIDYEIKGMVYRSSWSVEMNRNGKLKDYEMSFYQPDGTIADLKRSEVPAQNERIIGLKYDQFVKSILLSQGEFSKFLKADKNERGELLENITGTSVYRQIGQKAYSKFIEVKYKLASETEILAVLKTLDDEERQKLQQELIDSIKEKERLSSLLIFNTKLKQIKTEIDHIKNQLNEKKKSAADIQSQAAAFKPDQVKLDMHQRLSPVQGPVAVYNEAKANALKSKENVLVYKAELEKFKNKHQEVIDEMSSLTKLKVDEGNFKKIMNDFETEINNADRDLSNLINKGKESRDRVNRLKENYPIDLEDQINPSVAIQLLADRLLVIKELINKANLDPQKAPSEIKSLGKRTSDELEYLKEIQRHYLSIDELSEQSIELHEEQQKFTLLWKEKAPLIDKAKQLVDSLLQQKELLLKQREDAIKIAKLEELRHALVTGEACPLCGSLEHPFAEHNPDLDRSEIDTKITAVNEQLKYNQLELEKLNREQTEYKTSIDLKNKAILDKKNRITKETEKNDALIVAFKGDSKLEKENILHSLTTLTHKKERIERAVDALDEHRLNVELSKQYSLLLDNMNEYQELRSYRNSKFKGKEINTVTNKLQDDFEISKAKITELYAFIEKETESYNRDSSLVKTIFEELQPKIEQLGFAEIQEISSHLLDEATLHRLSQKRESLSKQQIRIETEIKTLLSDLDKLIALDTEPEQSLDAIQRLITDQEKWRDQNQAIKSTNEERIKRDDEDRIAKAKKEKYILDLKQDLDKWSLLNKMIGDAKGNKFANFAQGLTLQNLLAYANRRLEKLSDRYLLDKPENDGALIVIDKYQGNTSRSVTTLSGGESFLISLALALSLSDMASKNVALESLFIDEGFGTLDPDTLESAMNTLEKLQSDGQKTVGVISHVEALKDRIDVQVKLVKNAQGYSQIEIVNQNQS